MPAVLVVNGRAAIRIGETDYLLSIERAHGEAVYRLEKACGKTYVVRHRPGSWRCSCPSYVYGRGVIKECKHTRELRDLAEFLNALMQGGNHAVRDAEESGVHPHRA